METNEVFFERIKSWLKLGGYLFITTPYKQEAKFYDSYSPHVVFGITKTVFNTFLPGAEFKILNHPYLFRALDRNLVWRIGRGIKRTFFYYKNYVRTRLIVLWRK